MKRRVLLSVAGLAGGALLSVASVASAAPRAPCTPATMKPSNVSVLPANLPGFAYSATNATKSDVHLFAVGASRVEQPLTLGPEINGELKVSPASQLVPGTSYELQYQPFCNYMPYPTQPLKFTAGPAAPLPTTIGHASPIATPQLQGSGNTEFSIYATYALAEEMKPWAALYEYKLFLDGRIVSQTTYDPSSDGSLQISAYGVCDDIWSSTDVHTVELRGTLSFAPDVTAETSSLTFVCPAPVPYTPPPAYDPPKMSEPVGDISGTPKGTAIGHGCNVGQGTSSSLTIAGALFGLAVLLRRRRAP